MLPEPDPDRARPRAPRGRKLPGPRAPASPSQRRRPFTGPDGRCGDAPQMQGEGLTVCLVIPGEVLDARIGSVTAEHPGVVRLRTPIGGGRILDLPFGESLPRIC